MERAGRNEASGKAWSRRMMLARRAGVLALVAAALTLTIFPFDWLTQVWPAYRAAFDRVFVTARDHAIGHTMLFCLVGLTVLALAPALRSRVSRVWGYLGLGLLGALAQEAVQALAKQDWPNWGDGRDLLFDTLGLLLAFTLVQLITRGLRWRARTQRSADHAVR